MLSSLWSVLCLGLGFSVDLGWLAIIESLGVTFPVPVLCSVFLCSNMYACVWCRCVIVVWVVMASLYDVHSSPLFVIAI